MPQVVKRVNPSVWVSTDHLITQRLMAGCVLEVAIIVHRNVAKLRRLPERPPRAAHPDVHHLQALVPGAAQQLLVVRAEVHGGDPVLQWDLLGAAGRPGRRAGSGITWVCACESHQKNSKGSTRFRLQRHAEVRCL